MIKCIYQHFRIAYNFTARCACATQKCAMRDWLLRSRYLILIVNESTNIETET